MSDKTALGDRMKDSYENRTRILLPRRTYTILRLDGCHFHTWTKGLERPFDARLTQIMASTAMYLCQMIQGAQFAYTQSDEISILLTDFNDLNTEAWFDGNIQKLCSVTASMAAAYFNSLCSEPLTFDVPKPLAFFDCRAFTIPDQPEVMNYFLWRYRDCVRNSIQSAGQKYFSHKELMNKKTNEVQHMLLTQHNVNWSEYPEAFKNGTFILRDLPGYWCQESLNLSENKEKLLAHIPIKENWVIPEMNGAIA